MNFDQIWSAIVEAVSDHFAKFAVGFLLMGVGWYFGRVRARQSWRKQEFLDRLNLSLNSIDGGVLKIRTLSEKRGEDVFLNSAAADAIMQYAQQTTADDPILPIPQSDMWFYLNAVLNDLSEQFARGSLKRDMGVPVASAVYLVALTCETAGEVRTRKVRAMVARKTLLTSLPAETPEFEAPTHGTRWKTLQFLAAEYARHPWRFLEVELCV